MSELIEVLRTRLTEVVKEYEHHEAELETARQRRNILMTKLVDAGQSMRTVSIIAHVSTPLTSRIVRVWLPLLTGPAITKLVSPSSSAGE